jgi:PhnB protein
MLIQPYLFFEGRADEAIAFYQSALGAEVHMKMNYGDSPDAAASPMQMPADKVMHAAIQIGESTVMLSDGMCSGKPNFQGCALSLTARTDAEAHKVFDALADGGQVTMPMTSTFFASSFGMVDDRFGLSWMVINPRPMP